MKKFAWALLFAGILLSSCATTYDYYSIGSKTTDVGKYRTYAWLYPDDSLAGDLYGNSIAEDIIMGTAKAEFSKRGYTVDKEEPDLLVRYTVVTEEQDRHVRRGAPYWGWSPWHYGGWGWNRWAWGPGWGWGWSPWHYGGWGGWGGYTQRYEAGIVGIDLIDRRTGKLVWRGWSEGILPRDPERALDELPVMIHQIFEKFPVSPRQEKRDIRNSGPRSEQYPKQDMNYRARPGYITRI